MITFSLLKSLVAIQVRRRRTGDAGDWEEAGASGVKAATPDRSDCLSRPVGCHEIGNLPFVRRTGGKSFGYLPYRPRKALPRTRVAMSSSASAPPKVLAIS
jgi:hypothetical protein